MAALPAQLPGTCLEDLRQDLAELPRIGAEQQVADALHGLLRARGVLVVANDGRAFSVSGDPIARVRGVQRIAILAGRHGGGPGVLQVEADDLAGDAGAGRRAFAGRNGGGGRDGGGVTKLRRFISLSSWPPAFGSSGRRPGRRCGPWEFRGWWH